jgi:hypothetical protein
MRITYVVVTAAIVVATGGLAASAASSSGAHVAACATKHGALALKPSGKCAKGQHAISLPVGKGARGPKGTKGDAGPRGIQGVPGPFPAVVPSRKTLTGVWTIGQYASAANQYFNDATSFDFPFATAPQPELVTASKNDAPTKCTGTAAAPKAAPGYVCIYVAVRINATALQPYSPLTSSIYTATKYGWAIYAGSGGSGNVVAQGTWAATAS